MNPRLDLRAWSRLRRARPRRRQARVRRHRVLGPRRVGRHADAAGTRRADRPARRDGRPQRRGAARVRDRGGALPPGTHRRGDRRRRVAALHRDLDARVRRDGRAAGHLPAGPAPRARVAPAAAEPAHRQLPLRRRPVPHALLPAAGPVLARPLPRRSTGPTSPPIRASRTSRAGPSTRSECIDALDAVFATRTLDEWRERVRRRAVPVGAVPVGDRDGRRPPGRRQRLHRDDRRRRRALLAARPARCSSTSSRRRCAVRPVTASTPTRSCSSSATTGTAIVELKLAEVVT